MDPQFFCARCDREINPNADSNYCAGCVGAGGAMLMDEEGAPVAPLPEAETAPDGWPATPARSCDWPDCGRLVGDCPHAAGSYRATKAQLESIGLQTPKRGRLGSW